MESVHRRRLLTGLFTLIAAPAIVHAESLMPIRPGPRQATLIIPPNQIEMPADYKEIRRMSLTFQVEYDDVSGDVRLVGPAHWTDHDGSSTIRVVL